ncbi:MAG: glutamate synthase [Isosphaeraceae bacterium]
MISVPDIRDYHVINAELIQRLDAGQTHVRLAGAEGQRLLVSRLRGAWRAVVEVEGRAGPELAAELDCPGLVVVCRGPAGDGVARGLRAGLVVVGGEAGPGAGYAMAGGVLVLAGTSGPRAGLNQSGGELALLGKTGALGGERQSGGTIFIAEADKGAHFGRGRRAGRCVDPADTVFAAELAALLRTYTSWHPTIFDGLSLRIP